MCGLKEGAELEFINDSSKKCYVVSEKKVKYEEEEYSLSALAQKLLDKPYQVAGPHYFKYNGEILPFACDSGDGYYCISDKGIIYVNNDKCNINIM